MKRLVLAAAVLVALMSIGPAPAAVRKTVAVSITHTAFVPRNVTIQTGDVITWTNNDTVNHQLVSQQAGIGSPIIKPGDTYSFTFTKTGKFTISDSLNARYQKATVTVQAATPAPPTLTLNASASVVRYGAAVTLNGQLTSGRAGVRVDVFAQECGAGGAKRIATVTTVAGGNYSAVLRPSKTSVFSVKSGRTESAAVTVKVRPKVVLSKIRLRKFRVRAYAADSLVGHSVIFQRYVAARNRWTTVKRVVLRVQANAVTPLPSTVVSSVSFAARLRAGLRIRVVMTDAAAAPCYIAGSASARS